MIFVFGSNLDGVHGAGAARWAYDHHCAQMGVGEGLTGVSYALPTVGRKLARMSLLEVEKHVQRFIAFAAAQPKAIFQVTRIGCGLAGFTDAEIAPMFADAPPNCLFDSAWEEFLPTKEFWGTI